MQLDFWLKISKLLRCRQWALVLHSRLLPLVICWKCLKWKCNLSHEVQSWHISRHYNIMPPPLEFKCCYPPLRHSSYTRPYEWALRYVSTSSALIGDAARSTHYTHWSWSTGTEDGREGPRRTNGASAARGKTLINQPARGICRIVWSDLIACVH